MARDLRVRHLLLALLAALLALAAPLSAQDLPRDPPGADDLAVMGTIPIYWGERDDFADLLSGQDNTHWARPVIEAQYNLRPLDYLSAEALHGHSRLLLAQPRGLSAEENVALDAWVRGGGRLLLFADPMMTGHSRFAIGDRRRPQDVALLSPILAHWGLALRFDEGQAEGVRMAVQTGDSLPPAIPVNLPGQLALLGAEGDCVIRSGALVAECRLGAGRIVVVADAALFDGGEPDAAPKVELAALIWWVFGNPVPPSAPAEDFPANH